MSVREAELVYLRSQPLGRLATVQPNGTLQVSPVGIHYHAATSTIDIQGYNLAASRKVRNVADTGKVAFVVDDVPSVDPWRVRCVEIRGRAEALDAEAAQVNDLGGPTIRIHPERIISFGLGATDQDVHQLVSNARDV